MNGTDPSSETIYIARMKDTASVRELSTQNSISTENICQGREKKSM